MLKGVYLVNRVSNVYGWLIIFVTSMSGPSTLFVKLVSSNLNYVTLLKQLFKALLCIVSYREVSL